MELYLTDFRVSDLMEQTKTISQTLADKNGNSLVFEYADDEDDNKHIRGDETRLRQCVVNLISNAVKFTENGTVTITSTPYDKDDTKWLSIAVSDTGIGMTEEQLGKILQEYAQAKHVHCGQLWRHRLRSDHYHQSCPDDGWLLRRRKRIWYWHNIYDQRSALH